MIKGMTGFGSAQVSLGKAKAVVEIRSLNHRYFDLNCYLPTGFGTVESKIQQLVQKHVERGRVTVAVKITQKPEQEIVLNKSIIKKYLKHAKHLGREFGLKGDMTLSEIVRLPGVLEVKETLVQPEGVWPQVEKGIKKCLRSLDTMRAREGRALVADVTDKLKKMTGQVAIIRNKSRGILREKKKVLSSEEFPSFQKGCDINEEISRLTHYIGETKKLLRGFAPAGKKVDFLAQEMQRETNTIGSKLQDKAVINAVVSLKSKIEKIREQAQNIE